MQSHRSFQHHDRTQTSAMTPPKSQTPVVFRGLGGRARSIARSQARALPSAARVATYLSFAAPDGGDRLVRLARLEAVQQLHKI